jgi:hypothetical protein
MSTKTIKQRIAVVAVSALTVGLLSVISVPASNAAVVAGKENSAVGDAPLAATEHVLTIATLNSVTGTYDLNSTQTGSKSVGLINVSDIAGTRISGTTQTAVLISNGTLAVHTTTNTGPTDDAFLAVITVENGTIVGTQNADGISTSRNTVVFTDDTAVEGAAIQPNAGATQMIVRMYNGTQAAYDGSVDTEAGAIAGALANPALGTLHGQITVTIASTSASGAIAASKSGVYYVSTFSTGNTATSDTAGLGSANAVSKQYGAIRIRDIYSNAVASGGLLQVSATNGARVSLSDAVGTASTAFATDVADGQGFAVANPTLNPLATTVTVTYNGTVIGTKNFAFWGEVAKVVLSDPIIGKQGTTSGNRATFSLLDAANNPIYVEYLASDSTFTPQSGIITSAASDDTVTFVADTAEIDSSGNVTVGKVDYACSTTATKQNIQIQYVNNSGTVITSNLLPVTCAGNAVSYKFSYDKATYAPGEIATATVSFFDKSGNPSTDNETTTSWTGTLVALSISNSGMKGTGPLVAIAAGDDTKNGQVSYKYVVDVTEGTYTNSVTASTADSNATSALVTATKSATATITVKAAGTTVTNAEVLKSIVSLIASINKQIQALQKLILRR